MAGRRRKICDEQTKALLLEAIGQCMPYQLACRYARISETTFYDWKKRGEAGEKPFAEFLKDLHEAEAQAVFLMHADLKAAGVNGDTKATIFLLKARYPQHYSETVNQNVTGTMQVQTIPLPVFGPNDPLNHFDQADQEEPEPSGDDEPGD